MGIQFTPRANALVQRYANRAAVTPAAADTNGDQKVDLEEARVALRGLLAQDAPQIDAAAAEIGGTSLTALRAASPFNMTAVFPAAKSIDVKNKKAFNKWINAAHDNNPAIKAVTSGLSSWLNSTSVTRVGDVFDKALALGRAEVEKLAQKPLTKKERDYLAANFAMLGVAPIAIFTRGNCHRRMPKFLVDGRGCDDGNDKSRHLFAQAMFAWVVMYDEKFGDGKTAAAFTEAVEVLDKKGAAAVVSAEYERRQGAIGSFLTSSKPSPKERGVVPYQGRPSGLNDVEGRAYDGAVRMGDFYEWASSRKPSFDQIGAPKGNKDTTSSTEGMSDPGTVRDMTANRIGAALAVELFRKPSSSPSVPYDDGSASKPYA